MEDNELIKKCQIGDKNAFQQLISKYHAIVYKFLIKITENEELAEDLTQEVFIKVIRKIDQFDIKGKAKFSTYLISIAKNSYIDYLRKEKRLIEYRSTYDDLDIVDTKTNVEATIINKMYSKAIEEKMENLTEEQKIVIRMKYIEGLTLKEIGEVLELKPKTVKSRIHYAIVKIRKMFEKDDSYEGN